MKALRRLTFLTQLMLGLGLTLVIVGTVMAVGNYFISVIPLEHRMQEKARLTCWRFSQALRKHVWNMDDTALARYFADHPSELSGLVSIRVLTEFEDPIFTRQFSQETDLISCRSEVRYEGQLVGYIEADLNGHELQLAHEAIARSGVLIVSSGIVAILLAAILLTRFIIARPARRLVEALARIEEGHYEDDLPTASSREVNDIFRSVGVMAHRISERTEALERENRHRKEVEDELRALTDTLEMKVERRTEALRKAYETLREEAEERRQVQNEILAISDRERQRIGRDLHDSLGQRLTGVALLLAVLKKSLQKQDLPEAKSAAEIGAQMKAAVGEARSISHGLMPLSLQEGGVVIPLQRLVDETQHMYGATCTLKTSPDFELSSEPVAINVYRVTQEAIHNARRHGRADRIDVELTREDPESVRGSIVISDNGKGVDPTKPTGDGMGLRIMRYRAETMNGTLTVSPRPDGGTVVTVTFEDEPPTGEAEDKGALD